MTAIAIDIGGSHTVCAVVEGASILASEQIPVTDASSLARLLPELPRRPFPQSSGDAELRPAIAPVSQSASRETA